MVFFDWHGVIYYEFVARGQAVNKEFYVAVLKPEEASVVDEPEWGVAP